jgi:hypothetical protein
MKNLLLKPTSILLLIALLFSSCAQNLHINYAQYSSNQNTSKATGSLYLEPSRESENTSITIDQNIIVSRKHINSITIENIPEGMHHVHYSGGPWSYKEKMDEHMDINIISNKQISKIVPVPPYSTAYWIYSGAASILAGILAYQATLQSQPTYNYK